MKSEDKNLGKNLKIHDPKYRFSSCKSLSRVFIILTHFFLILATGCSYIQKKIDIAGLNQIADDVLNNFHPGSIDRINKFKKISLLRIKQHQ